MVAASRARCRRRLVAVPSPQCVAIGIDVDGWVAAGEFSGVLPVRRGSQAVEQAGGRQRERTGAHRHHPRTSFGGRPQGLHHRQLRRLMRGVARDDDGVRRSQRLEPARRLYGVAGGGKDQARLGSAQREGVALLLYRGGANLDVPVPRLHFGGS